MTITYLDLFLAVVLLGYVGWWCYRLIPSLLKKVEAWQDKRWEAKANALQREAEIDQALRVVKLLLENHKTLTAREADTNNALHSYSANLSAWAQKELEKLWVEVNKKENKLSDDDKFMKDAELSNQVTRIAQHAARKAIQDDKDRESLLDKLKDAPAKFEDAEYSAAPLKPKAEFEPWVDQKTFDDIAKVIKEFDKPVKAKKLPRPIKFKKAKK